MQHRSRKAELRTVVSRAGTEVEVRTVELCRRVGRVVRVVEVGFSALDANDPALPAAQHKGSHIDHSAGAAYHRPQFGR